ncbi:MAG: DUF971 domain-containing protein [Candidatus Eiseniibacteriota bacterium]|jgi:DUF971 family protein
MSATRADPRRPRAITRIGDDSLRIEWADGHSSTYLFRLLRRSCPCATCLVERQKAEQSGPFRVLGPEPSVLPARLEPVGNYAIRITWRDEHDSIFAFDGLRDLCPCDACAAGRG